MLDFDQIFVGTTYANRTVRIDANMTATMDVLTGALSGATLPADWRIAVLSAAFTPPRISFREQPVPAGIIHAEQSWRVQRFNVISDVLTLETVCTHKEIRRGRCHVVFETRVHSSGTELAVGNMRLVWPRFEER